MDSILYFGCFSSILFVGLFVWFYFQVELVCNCLCYFRAWFHMISLYGYLDMCIGYSWIRFFTFYLLVIHVHLQELGIFLYVLMNVQIRKLSLLNIIFFICFRSLGGYFPILAHDEVQGLLEKLGPMQIRAPQQQLEMGLLTLLNILVVPS